MPALVLGDFINSLANSDGFTVFTGLLTIIGGMTATKWLFKATFPYFFEIVTNYNIRIGFSRDSGHEKSEPTEIPWKMIDPHKETGYPISIGNHCDHRLRFEAEFTVEGSWVPNVEEVKLESLFKESFPGENGGLIAKDFHQGSGGTRDFTFPFQPHSNSCRLTVTVKPYLNVEELGWPHILAEFLGEIRLKEEKRYYLITVDDATVQKYLGRA